MIIRGKRPDQGFSIVDHQLSRDTSLSYRARGLLVAILSRPDDWRTDSVQLAREGKEGREAVRSALNELEVAGYIVRRKQQGVGGRWQTTMTVYDAPQNTPGQIAGGSGDASANPSLVTGSPPGLPAAPPSADSLTRRSDGRPAGHTGDGFPGAGLPDVGFLGVIQRTDTENRDEGPSDMASRQGASAPRPRTPNDQRDHELVVEIVARNYLGDLEDVPLIEQCLRACHGAKHPGRWLAARENAGELDGFIGANGLGPTCPEHETAVA